MLERVLYGSKMEREKIVLLFSCQQHTHNSK